MWSAKYDMLGLCQVTERELVSENLRLPFHTNDTEEADAFLCKRTQTYPCKPVTCVHRAAIPGNLDSWPYWRNGLLPGWEHRGKCLLPSTAAPELEMTLIPLNHALQQDPLSRCIRHLHSQIWDLCCYSG